MPPHRVAYATSAACAMLAAFAAMASCGTPPELRRPGSPLPTFSIVPSPSATTGLPSGTPLPPGETPLPPGETAVGSPSPSFAEEYAVPCDGYPSASQVIAMVRRAGRLLPRTGTVPLAKGPLCAGTWQYTVFSVPGKEPLQVVSRGTPGDLTMVTAGTDVCSIQVRTGAPAGIRNAAACPSSES